jgi:hypothetical protein
MSSVAMAIASVRYRSIRDTSVDVDELTPNGIVAGFFTELSIGVESERKKENSDVSTCKRKRADNEVSFA